MLSKRVSNQNTKYFFIIDYVTIGFSNAFNDEVHWLNIRFSSEISNLTRTALNIQRVPELYKFSTVSGSLREVRRKVDK